MTSEVTPALPLSSIKRSGLALLPRPPMGTSSPNRARRARFFFAILLLGDISRARWKDSLASLLLPSSLRALPRRLYASRSRGKSASMVSFIVTASAQRLCMASVTALLARSLRTFSVTCIPYAFISSASEFRGILTDTRWARKRFLSTFD